MRYETFIPREQLRPFVRLFAISESPDEQVYNVLPGTEVVMGFQYQGVLYHQRQNSNSLLTSSGITGILNSNRFFRNSADTGSVLVYFREGGAGAFFDQPVHELFNESISLENLMLRSELLVLEEQLREAVSDRKRIDILEDFLVCLLRETKPDLLVSAAVALIFEQKGQLRISELAKQLNISQSPLEKRFRKLIGTSPKKFSTIVRLKHTIRYFNPDEPLTTAGFNAGFYDQAHFIKEFKSLTSQTPEDFFRNQSGTSSERNGE